MDIKHNENYQKKIKKIEMYVKDISKTYIGNAFLMFIGHARVECRYHI